MISGNPYIFGIIISLVLYFGFFFLKKLFKLKENFNPVVYVLSHTTHFFMAITAIYVGFQFFPEHKTYPTLSWRIFVVVLMFQIGIWGSFSIKKWMQLSFQRKRKRDPAAASSINIVELMLKVSFLSIALIFTLHNLDIKVTTMLAGLGVGGIAIALALQNILGDLFASLSIILDKPFVIGDFIIMGDWMGTVEYIGLKTTRIRSLSGEQIIISNSDLLGSRIRNMQRMHERRNFFTISLPHETNQVTLKKAVEIITAIVSSKKQIRFERCHFSKVATSSLDIEVVYFILSDDYKLHMDLQQSILLDIHQVFFQENIRYANPLNKVQVLSQNNSAVERTLT